MIRRFRNFGPGSALRGIGRLCAMASVCWLATGCYVGKSIVMKPTRVTYEDQGNLVRFEEPRQKLLRVAKFEDVRGEEDQAGRQPRTWFFLLGYRQKGNFITDNKVWQVEGSPDGIGPDISNSVAEAFRGTNFFEEVKVEDSVNPSGGSGLILKARVEHFASAQHLNRYGYFLFVFWGSDYVKGLPTATCRINYQMVDAETDQILKQGLVTKTVKGGQSDLDENQKADIVEVGVKAARQASTDFANSVNQILLEL